MKTILIMTGIMIAFICILGLFAHLFDKFERWGDMRQLKKKYPSDHPFLETLT